MVAIGSVDKDLVLIVIASTINSSIEELKDLTGQSTIELSLDTFLSDINELIVKYTEAFDQTSIDGEIDKSNLVLLMSDGKFADFVEISGNIMKIETNAKAFQAILSNIAVTSTVNYAKHLIKNIDDLGVIYRRSTDKSDTVSLEDGTSDNKFQEANNIEKYTIEEEKKADEVNEKIEKIENEEDRAEIDAVDKEFQIQEEGSTGPEDKHDQTGLDMDDDKSEIDIEDAKVQDLEEQQNEVAEEKEGIDMEQEKEEIGGEKEEDEEKQEKQEEYKEDKNDEEDMEDMEDKDDEDDEDDEENMEDMEECKEDMEVENEEIEKEKEKEEIEEEKETDSQRAEQEEKQTEQESDGEEKNELDEQIENNEKQDNHQVVKENQENYGDNKLTEDRIQSDKTRDMKDVKEEINSNDPKIKIETPEPRFSDNTTKEEIRSQSSRKRSRSLSVSTPQQHKRFQHIAVNLINNIQAHRFSSPFLQAVNVKEAPDYHEVIYEAKDLKNILKSIKLKNEPPEYQLIKQLKRDILLMLANCIMYNKSDTDLVELTKSMKNDVNNIFKLFEEAELDTK